MGSQFTFSIGGQSIDIDNLSMTADVASDDRVAITFQDATNSELEFATLPENLWVLLFLAPFLPKMLIKPKGSRLSRKFPIVIARSE